MKRSHRIQEERAAAHPVVAFEELARPVIRVAFFGTWILIGFTVFWIRFVVRRTPRELMQLRFYQRLTELDRGLLFIGMGMMAGLFAIVPTVLSIDGALPWVLGWTLSWAGMSSYGFLNMARVFAMPKPSSPK